VLRITDGKRSCCGYELYNYKTQKCCNGIVVPGGTNFICCGNRAWDGRMYGCCGNEPFYKPSWSCCNGKKVKGGGDDTRLARQNLTNNFRSKIKRSLINSLITDKTYTSFEISIIRE
ncbi:unnamed protein product, partial [Owenia fusiformis]